MPELVEYTVPVLSPAAMRAWEAGAFSRGVSSLLLMEDAARALMDRLKPLLRPDDRILVACGPGNNGGDGAALGRLLLRAGYRTRLVCAGEPATADARTMAAYYGTLGGQTAVFPDGLGDFRPDCVVDALFGTGFHGRPEGAYAGLIRWINGCGARMIFAVDIPSGLNGLDGSAAPDPIGGAPLCVRATHTVALGAWKPGLLVTPHRACVGDLACAPIALPGPAPDTDVRLLTEAALRAIPPRPADAHKGTAGRVLLFMGSVGMTGAAAMAALAALRAGAGLVTVACPRDLIPVLQTLVPNAMCVPAETLADRIPPHDVLAAGCGLGRTADVRAVLTALLARETGPAVLDADALTLLADEPFGLPPQTVLTPHPGEAARLLHTDVPSVLADPLGSARRLAERYRSVVLLKGAVSVIDDGRTALIQRRGAPALAKGGSGDALAGILAAFCADRVLGAALPPESRLAACAALASLSLGLAGERAQARFGDRSPLTGDVIAEVMRA